LILALGLWSLCLYLYLGVLFLSNPLQPFFSQGALKIRIWETWPYLLVAFFGGYVGAIYLRFRGAAWALLAISLLWASRIFGHRWGQLSNGETWEQVFRYFAVFAFVGTWQLAFMAKRRALADRSM
jgi:hypothetical protein